MQSVQSGGNVSMNTTDLFQNFLDENPSMQSVQSGGNVSMNTNELFNKISEKNFG